ncbi:MAG: hypothetical protein ACD_74C00163G0001, partial [uncultured bacterium]
MNTILRGVVIAAVVAAGVVLA